MNPKRLLKSLKFCWRVLLLVAAVGPIASACPESVAAFHSQYLRSFDVCSIYDRYQAALAQIRKNNVATPERTGNVMAPRFINLQTWLAQRTKGAWKIYDPAPDTWRGWEAGVHMIDADAQANFTAHHIPALTLDWLKDVHGHTLQGLIGSAGKFREGGEIGLALTHESALTAQQIAGVRSNEYFSSLRPDEKLLGFRSTQCFEDRTPEFKEQYNHRDPLHPVFYTDQWPPIEPDNFFTAPDGRQKQCGYLVYSPEEEVQPQLAKWLEYINASTSSWNTASPVVDPILVASKAQRWMIVIHPYERGNGRMSRFVMDWILESIGLPAPLLTDMDEDVYSTEQKWAQEVGNGLIRAMASAEFCAGNPDGPGCNLIPTTAEGATP